MQTMTPLPAHARTSSTDQRSGCWVATTNSATGRGSAVSIFRTASGTASAFSPEGYAKFVSTLAPAWAADQRRVYGAFFRLNGDGGFPVPLDAYYMLGAGGQTAGRIPSHDLVVVRLGHFRGEAAGAVRFKKALALLMEAVPKRR